MPPFDRYYTPESGKSQYFDRCSTRRIEMRSDPTLQYSLRPSANSSVISAFFGLGERKYLFFLDFFANIYIIIIYDETRGL